MIMAMAAEIIGFIVLGFVALLFVVTVTVTVHDFVRARFPKYDLWLYDDNGRWSKRQRLKERRKSRETSTACVGITKMPSGRSTSPRAQVRYVPRADSPNVR